MQVVLLTCFIIRLMLVFFCNLSVFFMSFHLNHYYFHYLHSLLYHSFHLVLFWYYFYVKNWLNDLDFFVDGFLPKNHSFQQNISLFYTRRVVYLIVWFIHWVFCFSWPPSSILARPFLLVLSTEISIFFSSFLVALWVLCFSWRDSPYKVKFRLIFTDHSWVLLTSFCRNVLPFCRCRTFCRHFVVRDRWSRLIGSKVWLSHPFSFWFRYQVYWRVNRVIFEAIRFVFLWFCFSFG